MLDSDSACEAEIRLIRAADRCFSVKRFIPSEYNIDYDLGDDMLPYPEKHFYVRARKELEKTTTLEYTYIYPGMLMDYFGLPNIESCLRPLYFFIDPKNGEAVLPDEGEAKMSMTTTMDTARYISLALQLEKWPRIMSITGSTVTLNELVRLVEQSLGRKLRVRYQPVEKLLNHTGFDLPSNLSLAKDYPERFPEGQKQVTALIADLEAGVALGAFDFDKMGGEYLDLVKVFEGKTPLPKSIETFIEEAWGYWVK